MIERVRIENFKLLREVEVSLQRLTVVVGRNGVGKSSFLDAIDLLLSGARAGKPDAHHLLPRFNPVHMLSRGVPGPLVLIAASSSESFRFEWGLKGGPTGRWGASVSGPWKAGHPASWKTGSLGQSLRLRLNSEDIKADHHSSTEVPELGSTGAGIASMLQYLQGIRDESFERIEEEMRTLIPGAKRLRTRPVLVNRESDTAKGARFEVEWEGAGWVAAEHLSEGTLLVVALLTVLHCTPAEVILLDDVDKGLHPIAQVEVVKLLQRLVDSRPQLQIVATAHSPFVLDTLDATQMLVASSGEDGYTRIRPMSEHPGWAGQRGAVSLGEFWSDVGEGWVTEPARQ